MTSPLDNLNTYLQSIKKVPSLSWDDKDSGPKHEVVWTSICKLDGKAVGTGSGPTKRLARAAAAKNALAELTKSQETGVTAS